MATSGWCRWSSAPSQRGRLPVGPGHAPQVLDRSIRVPPTLAAPPASGIACLVSTLDQHLLPCRLGLSSLNRPTHSGLLCCQMLLAVGVPYARSSPLLDITTWACLQSRLTGAVSPSWLLFLGLSSGRPPSSNDKEFLYGSETPTGVSS